MDRHPCHQYSERQNAYRDIQRRSDHYPFGQIVHEAPRLVDDHGEYRHADHHADDASNKRSGEGVGGVLPGYRSAGKAQSAENAYLTALLVHKAGHGGETYQRRDQEEQDRKRYAYGAHLSCVAGIHVSRVVAVAVEHGPLCVRELFQLLFCLAKLQFGLFDLSLELQQTFFVFFQAFLVLLLSRAYPVSEAADLFFGALLRFRGQFYLAFEHLVVDPVFGDGAYLFVVCRNASGVLCVKLVHLRLYLIRYRGVRDVVQDVLICVVGSVVRGDSGQKFVEAHAALFFGLGHVLLACCNAGTVFLLQRALPAQQCLKRRLQRFYLRFAADYLYVRVVQLLLCVVQLLLPLGALLFKFFFSVLDLARVFRKKRSFKVFLLAAHRGLHVVLG